MFTYVRVTYYTHTVELYDSFRRSVHRSRNGRCRIHSEASIIRLKLCDLTPNPPLQSTCGTTRQWRQGLTLSSVRVSLVLHRFLAGEPGPVVVLEQPAEQVERVRVRQVRRLLLDHLLPLGLRLPPAKVSQRRWAAHSAIRSSKAGSSSMSYLSRYLCSASQLLCKLGGAHPDRRCPAPSLS